MRRLLFLILLLSCSCIRKCDLSPGEQMAYRIMGCFARKMEKEKGLQGIGFGGGGTVEKQKSMDIHFTTDETMTIDSARKLAVETTKDFVDYINKHESFRDQMIVYPFTEKNVTIMISGKKTVEDRLPFVNMVTGGEGHVYYFSDKITPPNFGCLYEETFEEAERILNEQKSCSQK